MQEQKCPNFENLLCTASNRGEKERDCFFFPYFESKNFSSKLTTCHGISFKRRENLLGPSGKEIPSRPNCIKATSIFVNSLRKKKIRRGKEGSLSELFSVNITSRLLEMVGANKNPYITLKLTLNWRRLSHWINKKS